MFLVARATMSYMSLPSTSFLTLGLFYSAGLFSARNEDVRLFNLACLSGLLGEFGEFLIFSLGVSFSSSSLWVSIVYSSVGESGNAYATGLRDMDNANSCTFGSIGWIISPEISFKSTVSSCLGEASG